MARSKQSKVLSARELRSSREEGYIVNLPSGHVFRMRPVALDVLMLSGKIPDLLSPLVVKTLWEAPTLGSLAKRDQIDKEFIELVLAVVPAALLEPKVRPLALQSTPLADDEVDLEDIEFADKVALFQLSIQPVEVLRSFRDGQSADVDDLSDGEDVRPETEQSNP